MGDDAALKEEIEGTPAIEPIDDGEHDEIVLIGDEEQEDEVTPTPPKRKPVQDMRKRIKEQNDENRDLRGTVRDLQDKVAQLTAGGEAAPVVAPTAKGKPTLAAYSYDSDAYEAALEEWHDTRLDARLDKRIGAQARTSEQDNVTRETEKAITGHYARASDLNVLDYEATEDAAIATLGADLVQQIQASAENSELILYYLGKKPEKASEIATLNRISPGKATLALGAIGSKVTLVPRTSSAPNPDMGVKGGGGGQSTASYSKHMKALQKAYVDGDLQAAQDVRKKAKTAGVELPFNVAE